MKSALQGFHYERCCYSPPPCKHDIPECAVTVAVGDDLFCAKRTFPEMDDMHTIIGHEYGLQVWYISWSPIPKWKSVCQHCYTHTHSLSISRGI
jgi:hypothetical protein